MTKKEARRNEALAKEIRAWLLEHELWQDVTIFFNGKAYSTSDKALKHFAYNDPDDLIEYEDDPRRCLEYYNTDSVTMTFEGPLYYLINDRFCSPEYAQFEELFQKHGLYFEQGYAWSLAAYEI